MDKIKTKLNKTYLMLLASFISFLLLNGCATSQPPPDVPICVGLSKVQGWCTNTISNSEFYIDDLHPYQGKTWTQWAPEMAMLPPASWASVKNWILAICEQENTCQLPALKKKIIAIESHWRMP